MSGEFIRRKKVICWNVTGHVISQSTMKIVVRTCDTRDSKNLFRVAVHFKKSYHQTIIVLHLWRM